MEGKEIIKYLDEIKVFILKDEKEKAVNCIEELKRKIESKIDKASEYVDDLLNTIK